MLIRVSELRQYTFCPRVIWHRVVMGQPTRETPKMELGRNAEDALLRLERRRRLRQYGLEQATRRFHVRLHSERLGLSGVCDLVLDLRPRPDQDGVKSLPVDVKTTRGGVGRHHVVQLAAYAMRAGVFPSIGATYSSCPKIASCRCLSVTPSALTLPP
jgi:CRISPR-associated exonuclease Cas4